MPLEDRIRNWNQNLGDSEAEVSLDPEIHNFDISNDDDLWNQDSNEEPEEEIKETNMLELLAYQDLIFNAPAYEWLLATLRKEFLLTPANSMQAIRQKIIDILPSSHIVSRRKPAETYRMTFEVDWDPLAFVKEQEYREEPDEAIERAITLIGSARDAQALTCAQYLCQTWPSAGEHTIRLVKDVVRSGPGHRHTCRSQA